ncbi:phage tail protein [Citrobacter sp. TSA-1]|uniref:phage tail-collar fiber domain-containing protein n=1 Tax=Citrobacter sp. TSA-1 TaxID=184912 RepID=UPI000BAE1F07|nr:phage tail protein [Citrobacter sp. TSA-1]PAX78277.1 phage tail protein [Citrobacter sp. TSA-1]QKE19493.1 phage tail protein [Citrobacter sp. TSA-1]
MSTIITEQYEQWCANQIISDKPARPDTFVFAYIPGQDESAEIPRDEKLPDAALIQYRVPVTQYGLLSPNAAAFSVILDTTVGDFDYNWIGLLNAESGVLCMIAHTPHQQKIKTANGVQGNNLIRTFSMEFDGAAAAMHIDVAADVWQIDFTARLAGMDESRRLLALDHYGDAAFLGDGFLVSYQDGVATVSAGVGYVGGLRVQLREPYNLPADAGDTIWIDASWQGFVTGEWNTVFTLCARPEHSPYTDENGFRHFVAPLAKVTTDGPQDQRPQTPDEQQSNALAEHEKSRRHPDATLSEKGFAQYSNATDSDAEDRAATSKAVKIAMDNANERLAKARHGADIPNKPLFIQNVGLQPTVDKANGAVQRGGDTMTGKLTLPQTSAFGVNTDNALGGNSISLGDNDTGIKQNGDGVLDVYANGQHVFRFLSGILESMRILKINGNSIATGEIQAGNGSARMASDGNIYGSIWGGWLSSYLQGKLGIQDVRLGAEMYYTPGHNEVTWSHHAPSGCVYTGIFVQDTSHNSADNIAGMYYRQLQKQVNNTWYNVGSI